MTSIEFTHGGLLYRVERAARYIAVHCAITQGAYVNVAVYTLKIKPGRVLGDLPTYLIDRADIKPLCRVSPALLQHHVNKLL